MEVLSEQGFRQDGRRAHELRRLQCQLGVYSQADGSACLEQGLTKVLAAVYGPHEIRRNRAQRSSVSHDKAFINCQYSAATFSTAERKVRPRGDRKSQEMQMQLQKTFEAAILTTTFPRSQIDIFCEVLQSDGANLAVCINAATLALIDAGVPMKDFVCACTVSSQNDTPIVDINYGEESAGVGPLLTMAVLPKSEEIVLLELNQRLHISQLDKSMQACMKACKDVFEVLDASVRTHLANVASDMFLE